MRSIVIEWTIWSQVAYWVFVAYYPKTRHIAYHLAEKHRRWWLALVASVL